MWDRGFCIVDVLLPIPKEAKFWEYCSSSVFKRSPERNKVARLEYWQRKSSAKMIRKNEKEKESDKRQQRNHSESVMW